MSLIRLISLLLAFAVPVQGIAAVAVGQCNAMDADSGHGMHEQAAHYDVNDDSHPADHLHEGGPQGEDGEGSRCGPCSACCGSATIAGPAGFRISPILESTSYLVPGVPPPAFTPGGFDRPPAA